MPLQAFGRQLKRGNSVVSRLPAKHIVSKSTYPLGAYNENKAQLRKDATAQYYRDHAIHEAAKEKSVRLKTSALLATARFPTENDLLRTAQYLQTELPVRVAHRIKAFQNLPFIIVTNPKILGVMELYIRSFTIIQKFNNGQLVKTAEDVKSFEYLLEKLMDDHANVIDGLTQGFRDCHDHVIEYCRNELENNMDVEQLENMDDDEIEEMALEKASELVQKFLDKTLTSRLGIRLLSQNHLIMAEQVKQGKQSQVSENDFQSHKIGIMEFDWSPLKAVNQEAERIRESYKFNSVCDNPPRIKFNGHTISRLTYIPMGVDYILREILKNSFRSVIESSVNSAREMKPIEVTIAVNSDTFTIRISDRGKGIEPEILDKIWRYYFTTFGRNRQACVDAVGDLLSMSNERSDKELAGYGIGLPMAKAYAEYLGGSLEIKTMVGIGTDVYLTLKHIDSKKGDSFRI